MLTISLLYGMPSFVLYILILFQIIRPKYRKTFNNPFFHLCFSIGVVDCLGYLAFFVFFHLPMYSLAAPIYGSIFFSSITLTTGVHFSLFMSGYLQIFGNCFLTLNRFTAIVLPLKHDKIWRVLLPMSIVITAAISIAPCWQLPSVGSSYVLQSGSAVGSYRLMLRRPLPKISFNLLLSISIACGLCLVLNVVSASFFVLRQNVAINRKLERNFFFVALIIFMVQSIHCVQEALYFISASTKNEVMMTTINSTLPWLMDLKFLSPPWIVLFVSSSVRETVMKMLPARLSPNHSRVFSIVTVHT